MKLTIALLLFFTFQVSAVGNAQKITIVKDNIPLADVFKIIEQQTGYHFFYDKNLIQKKEPIDVAIKDATLDQALSACLKDQRLTYSIVKHTIVIRVVKELTPFAYSTVSALEVHLPPLIQVRGSVKDENGNPLAKASVTIKGTNQGVTTNNEGEFTISVPNSQTVLIISFTGYTSQEILVGSRITINVNLVRGDNSLNEVVVTALGIKREKKALTYAVSEIGGEEISKTSEINLGNALSGKVAGVTASGTTGGPAGSSRVIIRGNGSLSGDNQPLYVVNGTPITNENTGSAGRNGGIDLGDGLSDINPDDIESISVLKGGTAASLYGARAANGAILITTKSGKAQKGIGIHYSTNYIRENAYDLLDWQYEYGSGSNGVAPSSKDEAIAYGRTSWGSKLDGHMVMQPDGEQRPYSPQKNNIKRFYQTGSTFSNSLAINGGNEVANFRFSASNLDNKGIINTNTLNRKTFNLNVNANLAKKLVFQGSAQYTFKDNENLVTLSGFKNNPNFSVGLLATNVDIRTLSPGYLPDGTEMPWSEFSYATNPYFAINKIKNGNKERRFIGSFLTKYNITDFLYASVRLGIDQVNTDGFFLTPSGIRFSATGSMTTNDISMIETNVESILGFNKKFGLFGVNLFAGGNQMRNQFSKNSFSSGNFNIPFEYFIGNGKSQSFNQGFSKKGINSLFAQANISFDDYLFMSISGRNDWFSTLDINNNSLFYPSVGLSFIVSDVWKTKPTWINYGKIRTSWAQVGGGTPSAYSIYTTYSADAVTAYGQTLMRVTSGTIPALLNPYTSTTTEAGLEVRAFHNRLSIDFTIYDRITTNDIVNASVAPSSGYDNLALNVGKIKNRGIELMVTITPIKSSNGFSWDMTYNVAYNKNKVIKIADELTSLQVPGAEARTGNAWIYHFEGQPFGMITGARQLTDEKGRPVFNRTSGLPVPGPLIALAAGVPPLVIGVNNSFRFKNFNLSFLLDSRWGASIYSATNSLGTDFGLHKNTAENNVRETGVSVSGVDEFGEEYSGTISAEQYFRGVAYTITDNYVEKADFIKLRLFSLGYNIPSSVLVKTPFQSANLSFVGHNLLLLYNASKNIDPESNYNNSNGQGLENFGLPSTRSYGINLNLIF